MMLNTRQLLAQLNPKYTDLFVQKQNWANAPGSDLPCMPPPPSASSAAPYAREALSSLDPRGSLTYSTNKIAYGLSNQKVQQ